METTTPVTAPQAGRAGHTQRAEETPRRDGNRHHGGSRTNVGNWERWASVLGGGALAAYGLSRRSLSGLLLAGVGGALVYRGTTGHCSVYQRLGINTAGPEGERASVEAGHGVRVEKSITIDRPRQELYQFWRNLENLPRVFGHLKEVRTTGDKRSHWVAEGPMGRSYEWDAEIINEKENELIAWRSVENADVTTAGSVHFEDAPGGRGTEIRVELKYNPPGGQVANWVARLFGRSPEHYITEDLRRFKQVAETGTAPRTQGQPQGA